MEYVSGMPLSRLLGRLTWPQIRAIAEDLSRILLYLHTLPRPVIHRDVKPKNIIVRHDGRVWRTWLVDFGSAEWEVQPRREHPPRPVKLGYGAFLYQPPEQLLADYAQLDRHADYFALGATLHAMIFGFPPYSNTERRSTSVRAAYREQERRLWTSKRLQHLPSVIREDLFQLLRFSPDLRQLPPSWLWPSSFGTGAGNR
jgi:serine/threonine protein kinase